MTPEQFEMLREAVEYDTEQLQQLRQHISKVESAKALRILHRFNLALVVHDPADLDAAAKWASDAEQLPFDALRLRACAFPNSLRLGRRGSHTKIIGSHRAPQSPKRSRSFN